MDEKALLEAMMLDEADLSVLASDLAKIAGMIGRAADATAELSKTPAVPDDVWLRIVPENDPAASHESANTVCARHEIADSGIRIASEALTVPRVVGGEA